MGKKNRKKHRPHSVLNSLKDLGTGSRDTLSRLATTVKADMPTLMLGTSAGGVNGTVKTDAFGPRLDVKPASRLSRFARKFVPFKSPSPAGAYGGAKLHTAAKMKKLSHQMAMGNPKMKIRRSRLPLVVVMLTLLFAGGGYYVYENVSLPKVGDYVDYKSWLGTASGQKVTQKTSSTTTYSSAGTYKAPKQTKAQVQATKKFNKLSRAEKEKIWKAKLAKLKKQSGAPKAKQASLKKASASKAKKAAYKKTSAKKSGKTKGKKKSRR